MCEGHDKSEALSPAAKSDLEKPQASGANAAKGQANQKARRRTKTGCLTCRRRRIKCGEERPVCANCTKSKRGCDGYARPMIIKPHNYPREWPLYNSRHAEQYLNPPPGSATYSRYPPIVPRLSGQGDFYTGPSQPPPNWPTSQAGTSGAYYAIQPDVQQRYHQFTPATGVQQSPTYSEASLPAVTSAAARAVTMGIPAVATPWQHQPSMSSPMTPVAAPHQPHVVIAQSHMEQPSPGWVQDSSLFSPEHHHYPTLDSAPTGSHPAIAPFSLGSTASVYDSLSMDTRNHHITSAALGSASEDPDQWQAAPSRPQFNQALPSAGPALLHEPASGPVGEQYDDNDDDDYDVMSDEEEAPPDEDVASYPPPRDVANILALATSHADRDLRSYHSFLDSSNDLAHYVPRFSISPLMDPATAKIFCHFVTATGPLISSFGRHPVNPALFFSGTPVPKSHQALWTYTIPTLALSNPALLESMLAVAALQISRLQSTPLTIPIKHYQFALRRVHRCVSIPSKRAAISTLAATLLLGHFEVISGEHAKWNCHLAGARQLLIEVDFKGMTKRIIGEKARLASNPIVDWSRPFVNAHFQSYGDDLPWVPEPNSIDESIVSQMTGVKIKYESHGSVVDESKVASNSPPSEKEMDNFQTYRDLFWFFTKLDMIQSLVRGRRLMLPYERWTSCPPRGPIGRIDAVYGSLDHVNLLMGRIGDFAGKDVVRKLKAVKMNGGAWRPPPGMFPGPPAQGRPGGSPPTPHGPPPVHPFGGQAASSTTAAQTAQGPQTAGGPSASPAQPSFYGMVPDTGTTYDLPNAFASAPRENIYVPPSPDNDFELATATVEADDEWKSIQKALTIYESSLGPSFAPLSVDAGPVIPTPFGLALQYRTNQVALCWLIFYMARIVSARTHPSMPPPSMVASGVAASQTAQWANSIGRIVFGMQTPGEDQPLNPVFGGPLAETMLPLFVAGVQYTDPLQRIWTIDRLHMIAERVGHDSAALIAAGLETVWVKQYEMGRAPKYDPTVKVRHENGEELAFETIEQVDQPYGKSIAPRNRRKPGTEADGNGRNGTVVLQPDTKDFARGLMGLERDFADMGIDGEVREGRGNRF